MALSTARMHRVRGRPPLLAAGINSLIHSHSSSVRSLGYIFSLIYLFYTTPEDFSDRLLEKLPETWPWLNEIFGEPAEFHSALYAYYMALHILELADTIASGKENVLQSEQISLDIPLRFLSVSGDVSRKGYRLFL